MDQGFDRDLKKYFVRIINSLFLGFLWLFSSFTAGIYFKLGYPGERPIVYTIIFYLLCVSGFLLLIRYYLRIWKR